MIIICCFKGYLSDHNIFCPVMRPESKLYTIESRQGKVFKKLKEITGIKTVLKITLFRSHLIPIPGGAAARNMFSIKTISPLKFPFFYATLGVISVSELGIQIPEGRQKIDPERFDQFVNLHIFVGLVGQVSGAGSVHQAGNPL